MTAPAPAITIGIRGQIDDFDELQLELQVARLTLLNLALTAQTCVMSDKWQTVKTKQPDVKKSRALSQQ